MIDQFLMWASTYQGGQTLAMFAVGLVFMYVYLVWMNWMKNH